MRGAPSAAPWSAPGYRAAAGAGNGLLFGSAAGVNNASASNARLQQRCDVACAQCRIASGNCLQSFPTVGHYSPCYCGTYGYPVYYGDYTARGSAPPVSLRFFGRFGPGFHQPSFFHSGFRRR